MLADPNISVQRFFERPDKEKQFLYQLLLKEDNPDGIIFTATGTGFTKSLSMRTNTLLRINILRHCIDFIDLKTR